MSDPRSTLSEIAAQCRQGLPMPPQADDAPVFAEPWQAQAFAMTVALHAKGLFTWPEWAAALTQRLRSVNAAGGLDDGSNYYLHWLDTLEGLVLAKQLGNADQLHDLEHAWEAAAARTPHGQPIELQPQDFEAAP
jgi:nitrile hydratase accessory protein